MDCPQPGRVHQTPLQCPQRNGSQQRRLYPVYLGGIRAELPVRVHGPAHRRVGPDRGLPTRTAGRLEVTDTEERHVSWPAFRHRHQP